LESFTKGKTEAALPATGIIFEIHSWAHVRGMSYWIVVLVSCPTLVYAPILGIARRCEPRSA
jgi:hypothetical protein